MAETISEGFVKVLGVQDQTADDGRATLTLDAEEDHLNPAGTVHGGVLATLVDTAMGHAVRSLSGEEDIPATSQLSLTFLRPGKPGRLDVTARVRKQGENLTICEAEVEQDDRTLVHAIATFAVLHG